MDSTVTDRQLAALENGEAKLYRGRVIPIIRGGSDFEGEAPNEPAEPAGEPAGEAASEPPAEAAAPSGFSLDDPAVQDAIDRRVAEALAIQRYTSQPEPAHQAAEQAEPVDWAELLNPLSDYYDPARFYEARDAWMLSEFDKRIEPLTSRENEAQSQKATEAYEKFLGDHWNTATDGPLSDSARLTIDRLSTTFLVEANARYGITQENVTRHPLARRAAEESLMQSAEIVRQMNRDARAAGTQSNIDGLAAVQNAAGEPGTGGGAHNVPAPARSPAAVLDRHFGPQLV